MISPKQFAFDVVERNREAIALLCDNIFYFAELGMQEFESANLMIAILETFGFRIERNLSGMPTGFVATYGSGHPVIALHMEFMPHPRPRNALGSRNPRQSSKARPGRPKATT
jgi:aminobenzoyl-glutamate utilization protein B